MKINRDYSLIMRRGKKLLKDVPTPVDEFQPDNTSWIKFVLIILSMIGIIIFFFFGGCQKSFAYTDDQAVKTIIGEAENQGFVGMLAVAHALRNRGTLKGCYGLRSPRVRNHLYSRRVFEQASRAWAQSAKERDFTGAATGWGNKNDLEAFAKCKWWRNCRITFVWADHYFYKRML